MLYTWYSNAPLHNYQAYVVMVVTINRNVNYRLNRWWEIFSKHKQRLINRILIGFWNYNFRAFVYLNSQIRNVLLFKSDACSEFQSPPFLWNYFFWRNTNKPFSIFRNNLSYKKLWSILVQGVAMNALTKLSYA